MEHAHITLLDNLYVIIESLIGFHMRTSENPCDVFNILMLL